MPRVAVSRMRRGPARPTWSFRYELLARTMRRTFDVIAARPIPDLRAAFDAMANTRSPALAKTTRTKIEPRGVPSEWFAPRDDFSASGAPVVLYLHGGGYVFGSTRTHAAIVARIALAARARVLVPNYRLAPEHPYPAAVDDALAVYEWLLAEGVPASRIVVGGDSAGGGLTMSLLLRLRDAKRPLPAGAVLISPWVDHTATGGSADTNATFDYATIDMADAWRAAYLPNGHDLRDPILSPVYADLAGLPPLLVQVGAAELLHDQVNALAARAKEHGVDVKLEVEPDMIHVWHSFADFIPECRRAIDAIGDFVRSKT
jgi:acetyl esterase/lipase